MKFANFLLISSSVILAVSGTAIIDSSLKQRFIIGGRGDTQNVMISFTQGIDSVIQRIKGMSFSSPAAKRSALTNAEQTFANGIQGGLKAFLSTMGVQYESFWINNKMVIQNVDSRLVNAISNIPGVAKVEKEPVVNLNPVDVGEPEEIGNYSRYDRQSGDGLEWGIKKIRANKVWEVSGKGKGIVVAGIDTGVRHTHEALRGRWRPLYGWLDPIYYTSRPSDFNGHGTHTMGTIVGTNGIGVAPEATWIACRGCTSLSCTARALMRCGEWVLCPNPRENCTMAPDIVSNSWGGGQDDDWYDGVIQSWQAAGIIPVVSIGNSGPECKTANTPGDRPNVIGVGSTEEDDTISSFSSLGPTKDDRLKPDISAPGGKIRSAWYTSDRAYNTISGTSMACPHVSGVVALMLEKNYDLSYDQVYTTITSKANTSSLDQRTAPTACGNSNTANYPNNVFGFGLIDALDSINAIE